MSDPVDGREILGLDRLCLDAAEVFLDSLEDHPSPVGFRMLERRFTEAGERLAEWRPDTGFETLLARHLRTSWSLLLAVARYRFRWPGVPVSEVVEALAGPEAISRLESYVREADPDAMWSYLEARHRYRAGRVGPDDSRFRSRVESVAGPLVEEFRGWIADQDWELPGIDAEVEIGGGDVSHSWYRPASHRVVLGGAEFMVFGNGEDLSVNPVTALHSLAHELAGHAVHDALCRPLPPPLRPDHRARVRFATLPVAEGFAAHAATLSAAFAEERGGAFGMDDEDIRFLRSMIELTPLHHAVPAFVAILAARARQEPGFDPVSYAADQCGHEGFGEMLGAAVVQPVNKLIYECACFFGAIEVERNAVELERRGMDRGRALRRLGAGSWTLDCFADAALRREEQA